MNRPKRQRSTPNYAAMAAGNFRFEEHGDDAVEASPPSELEVIVKPKRVKGGEKGGSSRAVAGSSRVPSSSTRVGGSNTVSNQPIASRRRKKAARLATLSAEEGGLTGQRLQGKQLVTRNKPPLEEEIIEDEDDEDEELFGVDDDESEDFVAEGKVVEEELREDEGGGEEEEEGLSEEEEEEEVVVRRVRLSSVMGTRGRLQKQMKESSGPSSFKVPHEVSRQQQPRPEKTNVMMSSKSEGTRGRLLKKMGFKAPLVNPKIVSKTQRSSPHQSGKQQQEQGAAAAQASMKPPAGRERHRLVSPESKERRSLLFLKEPIGLQRREKGEVVKAQSEEGQGGEEGAGVEDEGNREGEGRREGTQDVLIDAGFGVPGAMLLNTTVVLSEASAPS